MLRVSVYDQLKISGYASGAVVLNIENTVAHQGLIQTF
jgi:hypothetical protein